MVAKLTNKQVESALDDLTGWSLEDGKLFRQFIFNNFIEAFGFMTQVALLAETQQHHPEWFNSYRKVSLWLTTHEIGGLSNKDVELARSIDKLPAGQTAQ